MRCKDFNLILCPACTYGDAMNNSICKMVEYRTLFNNMRVRDVKDLFIISMKWKVFLNDSGVNMSYYIAAAIDAYYPQYKDAIDKIRILL